MSEVKTLSLSILEREYRIKCPDNKQDELLQAAHFLDKRMKEIRQSSANSGKIMGTDAVAVIAALNIVQQMQDYEREQQTCRHALSDIHHKLDEVMEQERQLEL